MERFVVLHFVARDDDMGEPSLARIRPPQVPVEPQRDQVAATQRADQQNLDRDGVHRQTGRLFGSRLGLRRTRSAQCGLGTLHEFRRQVKQHGADPGRFQPFEPAQVFVGHAPAWLRRDPAAPIVQLGDVGGGQTAMVPREAVQKTGDIAGSFAWYAAVPRQI